MGTQKHILLTGMPGVGKTTLIKNIYDKLSTSDAKISGFYTEELRDKSNMRLGFDIVTLDGRREKLARTMSSLPPNVNTRFKVGQYVVFPNEFEKFAIPLISNADNGIIILDEIGKMELLSNKFKTTVEDMYKKSNCIIIATIPVARGRPIPTVESIRNSPNCKVFNIDKTNRNHILEEILQNIKV